MSTRERLSDERLAELGSQRAHLTEFLADPEHANEFVQLDGKWLGTDRPITVWTGPHPMPPHLHAIDAQYALSLLVT